MFPPPFAAVSTGAVPHDGFTTVAIDPLRAPLTTGGPGGGFDDRENPLLDPNLVPLPALWDASERKDSAVGVWPSLLIAPTLLVDAMVVQPLRLRWPLRLSCALPPLSLLDRWAPPPRGLGDFSLVLLKRFLPSTPPLRRPKVVSCERVDARAMRRGTSDRGGGGAGGEIYEMGHVFHSFTLVSARLDPQRGTISS